MQISPPLLAITTFLASNEAVNHVKYLGRHRDGRGRVQEQGRGTTGVGQGVRQGRAIAKGVISKCIDRSVYTCRQRLHYLEDLH